MGLLMNLFGQTGKIRFEGFTIDGARHLPYEESRDRIPTVIEIYNNSIKSYENHIQNIKDKKVSIYRQKRLGELVGKEIKPEDSEYDKLAPIRISNIEYEIKCINSEILNLQKRYDSWIQK